MAKFAIAVVLSAFFGQIFCASLAKFDDENLHKFLDGYYDNYLDASAGAKRDVKKIGVDFDAVQGDQPMEEVTVPVPLINRNYSENATEVLKYMRDRTKENWIQMIKDNILIQTGRANVSISQRENQQPFNLSQLFPSMPNQTNYEDYLTKKIRTFYPSCETPEDIEFDNEDKSMNLFFNYTNSDQSSKIALATLRLYRIPTDNSSITFSKPNNCTDGLNEDEKLIRISVYWYIKPSRTKRRVKQRLCDSKVITESTKWVELSVTNAVRSWSKDENLGLAVQVEDQDGNVLKTDKILKGPICLVGMTTPKPIPSVLMDSARTPEELFKFLGRNATSAVPGDILLLPTIDVCTIGYPITDPNGTKSKNRLPSNACNFRQMQEQAQKLLERDQLERLAALAEMRMPPQMPPPHRHIRHQHNFFEGNLHNLQQGESKVLMTRDQVFRYLSSYNKTKSHT